MKSIGGLLITGLLFLTRTILAQPGAGATTPMYQTPMFKYYVWGQVRSPGAYSLSANPDVVELLSAGGGPTTEADLSRVVLIRAISKNRVRINLKRVLNKGEVIPLSPGDVVIVPRSFWYGFRDQLTIVTSVAILANLTLTIINLTQK
ncbi:MAG: polysaccharide biosynthesis/export family protein [bacterium]